MRGIKSSFKAVSAAGILALVSTAGILISAADASSPRENAVPESPQYGLAERYPGDDGIEADSAVVFVENFENGDISSLSERWNSMINPDGQVLSFAEDAVPGGHGSRSIMLTATKGHDTGGDLWKLLDRGYDRLYARFYVKFAPDAPYVHHFVSMGGKTDSLTYPVGRAGFRPDGYDRFGSSLDLVRGNADPPGKWSFYTYWCEMRSWQTAEGLSDGRPNAFYGNLFGPDKPEQAKRGQWQCVEMMIKLNTPPDGRDGEQAFWIDGRPVGRWAPGSHIGRWFRDTFRTVPGNDGADADSSLTPFEGFLWRRTDRLKINVFRLQYYVAHIFEQNVKPDDPAIPYNSEKGWVRFDNVVLATRYIGPVKAKQENR